MEISETFRNWLGAYRAAEGAYPTLLLDPASKTAQELFEVVEGKRLATAHVVGLPPHRAVELLVDHPDLGPDQRLDVHRVFADDPPPGECWVVDVQPTAYHVRRAAVGAQVVPFGPVVTIPYCEPKSAEEALAEFLAEHPGWRPHARGERWSAAAGTAFGRWVLAKEYAADPTEARAFVAEVRRLRSAG